MAPTAHNEFLSQFATFDRNAAAWFERIADQVARLTLRASLVRPNQEPNGHGLTEEQGAWLRDRVRRFMTFQMVGQDRFGQLAPTELIGDTVIALAPYPRLLFAALHQARQLAVAHQRALLEDLLASAPDVAAVFFRLWDSAAQEIVQEQSDKDELGRYVATYDPLHLWVDPGGYELSQRIWRNSEEMRRKLDLYLKNAIESGKGAATITEEVMQFLRPGQALPLTKKPYGTSVAYNAMRLARTEISAAYHQAALDTARMNPFIKQYAPALSRSHPEVDICDQIIDEGPYRIDDNTGRPPLHPQCLCGVRWIMPDKVEDVIERLRAELQQEFPEKFDQNGMLGLADSVRVRTIKWVPKKPGESLTGPYKQVIDVLQQPALLTAPPPPQLEDELPPSDDLSNHIEFEGKKVRPYAKQAVEYIEQVHQVPEDLASVPIRTGRAKRADAMYYHYANSNNPSKITMTVGSDRELTSLIHELGHYLDNAGFGSIVGREWGTDAAVLGQGPLALWWESVRSSATYQKLLDMRANPSKYAYERGGYTYQVNTKYIAYLLQPNELFARSYEQFIAGKTGNVKLQSELGLQTLFMTNREEATDTRLYPNYWDWNDYADILAALNLIFEQLGWLL